MISPPSACWRSACLPFPLPPRNAHTGVRSSSPSSGAIVMAMSPIVTVTVVAPPIRLARLTRPGADATRSARLNSRNARQIQIFTTRSSANPVAATGQAPTAAASDSSNAGTVLGSIALVLAPGALVGLGLLWSRTPMSLPSDDDTTPRPAPATDAPPPPPSQTGPRSRKRRSG